LNATPNPVNSFAAVPGYAGIYASLYPGGVVSDPQIGNRNRFTTFDISSGEGTNWSQELRLQSNFDGPFNFNVGAIYIDFVSNGDYYVMFNTLTADMPRCEQPAGHFGPRIAARANPPAAISIPTPESGPLGPQLL
jgi:hypothetical protein